MVCLCCHTPTKGRVCGACLSALRPSPERLLPGGIRVITAFEHERAARHLMHLLKYRGVTDYAGLVADRLVGRLPEIPLAPIPRAWSRRLKYGVDPALEIARAISARNGQPVLRALAAPVHSPRRAGGDHRRPAPSFRVKSRFLQPVAIVDDVVTTGATLMSAVRALGPDRVAVVAAANAASRVSSLPPITNQQRR